MGIPLGFTNDRLVSVKLYKVTGMARIGRKEMVLSDFRYFKLLYNGGRG
jgi:hypothetical protein